MTTGPTLGTSFNADSVKEIAKEVGFTERQENLRLPLHANVDGIRLQIHTPSHLRGVEGVVTEIEFDDLTNRFPNNPEAIDVLGQLYSKIPDLQYLKSEYLEVPKVTGPVSELLTSSG